MSERTVKIAFLGFGNIGGGVYNALNLNSEGLSHREELRFELKRALVRDLSKPRPLGVPSHALTTNFNDILNDPEIELVAEFMGGIEPAAGYLEQLLLAGKTVVTANKEAVAYRWSQLEAAARRGGAGLYYEASVCGGIPVIKTINESMQSNEIEEIKGIINGTTNYMLTRMSSAGLNYADALDEAQRLGIAEPDPTNDVEGIDAACKLSILASLAFHTKVPVERVFRQGITMLNSDDIAQGKEMGYEIKMLAIGKKRGHNVEARIHPTFIHRDHPLAAVRDSYNAVFLRGNTVGNLMLYGRGAGDLPTASAIISDMVTAAKTAHHRYNTFSNSVDVDPDTRIVQDWNTGFFLHFEVQDRPGVLADIAGVLAKHNVSIASLIQKGWGSEMVPIYMITHRASEKSMLAAIEEFRTLPCIGSVAGVIRVED